jgi:ParB-like chromosome segregation protein Spo0J
LERAEVSAVETIDIDLIDLVARLRPVDETAIPALAASLAKDGLLQPIGVRRSGQLGQRFTLIWGAHRLMAAQSLGWRAIQARVYAAKDMPDGVSATELEAMENLSRAELSPYDRAMTVAALRAEMLRAAGLVGEQDARTVGGFAKAESTDSANLAVSNLAERIGVSTRVVERDLKLAKTLQPALATAARGKEGWTNASVVTSLSELPAEEQLSLASWLIENPQAALRDALVAIKPSSASTLTSQDKAVNAVTNGFTKVKAERQPLVLHELFKTMTDAKRAEFVQMIANAGGDGQ